MNPTTQQDLQPMLKHLAFTKDQLNNMSGTILVVCNDWNNTDVELTVFAPGPGPDIEDQLHEGLADGLRRMLTNNPLYARCVVQVVIEEDNKVVVEINEPRHVPILRDMVMSAVPLLLAPWTIDQWRTLYLAKESEKLVVAELSIPFDQPGHNTFDLTLPVEIELHNEGAYLTDHLIQSVRAFPFVRDVFVSRKGDQRVISVVPHAGRHWSDRDANDMLGRLIGAFASQVKVQDHQLVFMLDRPYVNPDDGSDYEPPFIEY